MADPRRLVLQDVPKLGFGPESDVFSKALQIVLNFVGEENVGYPDVLCRSGRGFKICWNATFFYWDRHMTEPEPDPEYYLRFDYASARRAVDATGFGHKMIANQDCAQPEQSAEIGCNLGHGAIREHVINGISHDGRPIMALFNLSSSRWMPEWSIITGYDDGGAVITGWSCFQEIGEEVGKLDFEPCGYFRKRDWERDTAVVVKLQGSTRAKEDWEREALQRAAELSQGTARGQESLGFASYGAWADAIRDDAYIADVPDSVLKGGMDYHSHFIGHLAAQKWYSSVYLQEMDRKVWSVGDVLHASANYATIHELMWDCWQIAGGYWRNPDEELSKFRNKDARAKIANIIKQVGDADEAAVRHLESALKAWDKTHRYYLDS